MAPFEGHLWHRSFYDHIVRDRSDLGRIRTYIISNSSRWTRDEHHHSSEDA